MVNPFLALTSKGRHLIGRTVDSLDYYEDYVVDQEETELGSGDSLVKLTTPEGITVVMYSGTQDIRDAVQVLDK